MRATLEYFILMGAKTATLVFCLGSTVPTYASAHNPDVVEVHVQRVWNLQIEKTFSFQVSSHAIAAHNMSVRDTLEEGGHLIDVSDEELAHKILEDNPHGVTAAYQKYNRQVALWIRQKGVPTEDILGLVHQILFEEFPKSLSRKPSHVLLPQWLHAITNNWIFTYWATQRKHRAITQMAEEADAPFEHSNASRQYETDPVQELERREQAQALRQLFTSLPRREQQILRAWLEGETHQGGILDITRLRQSLVAKMEGIPELRPLLERLQYNLRRTRYFGAGTTEVVRARRHLVWQLKEQDPSAPIQTLLKQVWDQGYRISLGSLKADLALNPDRRSKSARITEALDRILNEDDSLRDKPWLVARIVSALVGFHVDESGIFKRLRGREPATGAPEETITEWLNTRSEEILAELPDAQFEILGICYGQALSNEQAATRLGIGIEGVRSRLRRAYSILRSERAPLKQATERSEVDPELLRRLGQKIIATPRFEQFESTTFQSAVEIKISE